MKKLHNFNYQKAIDIQALQLAEWAKVIKPEIFKQLLSKVCACNVKSYKTENALDIVRGEEIAIILNNIINK